MNKKVSAAVLSMALMCNLGIPAFAAANESSGTLAHFSKKNVYTVGQFTDVSTADWFAGNVACAYEYGLMKGTSDTAFDPNAHITLGSVLAMASRLHSMYYTAEDNFVQGDPWYQVYVDYCKKNGIIDKGALDYNVEVTRAEFASILANAFPPEALKEKNLIHEGSIPDVGTNDAFHDAVYRLYRAGVLTGSDGLGSFLPDSYIDRASVAAIVSRMALPDQRKDLKLKAPVEAEQIMLDQNSATVKVGQTMTLKATVLPDNTSNKIVSWRSSNKSVATVDELGVVTAKEAGTATIRVETSNGIVDKCELTVVE